jgi:hypothetical protein
MSYQLTHVFVSSLGSEFSAVLKDRQIVIILLLTEQLNFDIVKVAVIHKGQIKLKFTSVMKTKNIVS